MLMKPFLFFVLSISFVACAQNVAAAPAKVDNLAKNLPADTWFKHFEEARAALQKGEIETACKETDTVLQMADACDNKLPPGPPRSGLRSDFSDYIREFAHQFSARSPEILDHYNDSIFERIFYTNKIDEQCKMHLKYAAKLYQKAIYIESSNGDTGLLAADMTDLTESLVGLGESDKAKKNWQMFDKWVIENEKTMDPYCKMAILTAQVEHAKQEGDFSAAEKKLQEMVHECEAADHKRYPNLKKLLDKNTSEEKRYGNGSGMNTLEACGALQMLAAFYESRQQYQKEEATRLKLMSLESQIIPAGSPILSNGWRLVSDCYRREQKLPEAAEADKKAKRE